LRLRFRDDREDLDWRFRNVIERSDVAHAEAVLRLTEPSEFLDPALADFGRFVREMHVEGALRAAPNRHPRAS
jgi:hypothetical protein